MPALAVIRFIALIMAILMGLVGFNALFVLTLNYYGEIGVWHRFLAVTGLVGIAALIAIVVWQAATIYSLKHELQSVRESAEARRNAVKEWLRQMLRGSGE